MLRRLIVIFAVALAAPAPAWIGDVRAAQSLQGSFLVASPHMEDPRFEHAVIFMIHHDDTGAMGLIVNKVLPEDASRQVLNQLGIDAPADVKKMLVHFGGPVGTDVGFVLHTPEYHGKGTLAVTPYASLTASAGILAAIAAGKGPKKSLFALGYAGWGPGQLENEIRRESWTSLPGDAATLFDADPATLWSKALAKSGIDL